MLKKRLVFTLLYSNGSFMLSRNFRLQRIGDLNWLQRNYLFSKIAAAIDELIVINVSTNKPDFDQFANMLKQLTKTCFIPIAGGGWVRNVPQAQQLLRSGADKIVLNSPVFQDAKLIDQLAEQFGRQSLVASVDIKRSKSGGFDLLINRGQSALQGSAQENLLSLQDRPIGDLYLNSIDRDGTGQGYDLDVLDLLPATLGSPVILAGGAGNANHLEQGLRLDRVNAVATAHLLNFVGNGLHKARESLIASGINLPVRDSDIDGIRLSTNNGDDSK